MGDDFGQLREDVLDGRLSLLLHDELRGGGPDEVLRQAFFGVEAAALEAGCVRGVEGGGRGECVHSGP